MIGARDRYPFFRPRWRRRAISAAEQRKGAVDGFMAALFATTSVSAHALPLRTCESNRGLSRWGFCAPASKRSRGDRGYRLEKVAPTWNRPCEEP
jgi:hypothetical protein